jgi:hypothetical protein
MLKHSEIRISGKTCCFPAKNYPIILFFCKKKVHKNVCQYKHRGNTSEEFIGSSRATLFDL